MLYRLLLGLPLLCALAPAQTRNAAELLGYPATTKLLIVHADDLAVSHSEDRASFAALDRGAASSASIMVPCPWLTEVAEYAKAHPDADLGLHLTLTSEWNSYRWGPVASRNLVPGLLAADGNLWPDSPFVTKNARPAEVEMEIRAQVERAIKVGIHPTHLDSHMAALFNPAFFSVYVKVAREYGLPFLALRTPGAPAAMLALLKDNDLMPGAIVMATGGKPEDWKSYYLGVVKGLKPGLTELIVHMAYDDAEMQAVTEGHPAYGQRVAAAGLRRDHRPGLPPGAQGQPGDADRLEDHSAENGFRQVAFTRPRALFQLRTRWSGAAGGVLLPPRTNPLPDGVLLCPFPNTTAPDGPVPRDRPLPRSPGLPAQIAPKPA
ncbi:MAG TPA: polysaccharide deacetylase family protein [Bryobacteraceae bacterium]|nr:polysaccharide deacetylase family protein [Bryobacteraceae bacterium]